MQSELTANTELIGTLQDKVILLEEEIDELNAEKGEDKKMMKKDGKIYSTDMRIIVYTSIVSQVPTQNSPQSSVRSPHRTVLDHQSGPHTEHSSIVNQVPIQNIPSLIQRRMERFTRQI